MAIELNFYAHLRSASAGNSCMKVNAILNTTTLLYCLNLSKVVFALTAGFQTFNLASQYCTCV